MNAVKKFFKINSHSVVLKPLAGLGRSINRIYENWNHDSGTNGELTVLKKLSQLNPRLILDVGANTGEYALSAAEYCKDATVYSFEPVKSTFDVLQASIDKSGNKLITAINKGLYKANGQFHINVYPRNALASLYDIRGLDYPVVGQEIIEVITGDDFIREHKLSSIDFLKMDVEGAEMDVLEGMKEAFGRKVVRLVQFEYGYINITTKNLLADYHEFFKGHGYIVGKIYPKSVEFRDYSFKHEDFIGPNFVAVKREDEELIRILSEG